VPDPDYLRRQKTFWNVATLDEARFDRVDTRTDRTEESWVALADADIRHVFDGVVIPEHATILELGCGVGRLLVRTRQQVPESVRIIGVDISESMVKFATEATAGLSRISLHVTDGASLSMVASNSVTFAYSLHVFIHMNDGAMVRSYLRELSRVLVRGGRFRFNTRHLDVWRSFAWSPGGVFARLKLLTGVHRSGVDWRAGDPTDFNGLHWRANDLRRELEQAGFRVESIGPKYEADELWCDVVKL
jgi:ubiquinone/menaquinone biosynthesis C-methylase UbiE